MYAISTVAFLSVLALVSSLAVVVQADGPRTQCIGASSSSSPFHSWSSEKVISCCSMYRNGRCSVSLGISYLSVAPPNACVLTVLLTTRNGDTCATFGDRFSLSQDAILSMNSGLSCKCP